LNFFFSKNTLTIGGGHGSIKSTVSSVHFIEILILEANFDEIDAKSAEKVQKSSKNRKNPKKSKIIKLNRADQKLFF
jgi:hypothetical protein